MVLRRLFAPALLFALALPQGAPAAGTSAAPPAAPLVTILGDSITAGLGLAAEDALPARLQEALARRGVRAVVRGAGVSGDTTAGGLARLDFSVTPQTRVCVVELGANDFLQSVPTRETKSNLTAILKRLRSRGIPAVLAAGSAPRAGGGAYGRELTAAFAAAAKAGGAALVQNILAGVMDHPELRQADGLHPNRAGVRILADRLAPAVAQALAKHLGHRP